MSPNWTGGWETANEPTIRERLGEWTRDRDVDWQPVVRLILAALLAGMVLGGAAVWMVLR